MPTEIMVGPRTKGLCLDSERPLDELNAELRARPRRVDDAMFSWPLLTLDDAALTNNIDALAIVCRNRGLWHAPHVKTPMSAEIWARQAEAGAWAPTVAMPSQLRAVLDWGATRALLANELVDAREARWLASVMAGDPRVEVWLEVDSATGVDLLASAFASLDDAVRARLHPLIEVGVPGERTGVRGEDEAVALVRRLIEAKLRVDGVIGFEGPAATGSTAADRAIVAGWARHVLAIAVPVAEAARAGGLASPFIFSLGGSAYLDAVLPAMAEASALGWQGVVRSGAYVTHDHGHYAGFNPLSRLPDGVALRPAITIYTQVMSEPEAGLALLDAGRRDLAYDMGLPVPLWWRQIGPDGRLGPATPFEAGAGAVITQLYDQHAVLHLGAAVADMRVGDIVGLGISHPCTAFDKWRVAALTSGDDVIALYWLDF